MRLAIVTYEGDRSSDKQSGLVGDALRAMGHEVSEPVWSDESVDWSSFDVAWVCSTWDYFNRPDEFRDWVARAGVATNLQNPRVLIDWNIDKRYLRELGGEGVPIVPTVWAMPELSKSAQDTVGDLEWDEVVVKPLVDGGAFNLEQVRGDEVAAAVERAGEPTMVQPLLPSVSEEGELSLVFFRGELSHAIRKTPKPGDFRIQEHWGGRFRLTQPNAGELASGKRTLDAMLACSPIEEMPLYARVDLVRDLEGRLCTIELEVIEPSLYLEHAPPEATREFARLLVASAG